MSLPIFTDRRSVDLVDLMGSSDIGISKTDTLAVQFDGPRALNLKRILLMAAIKADYWSVSEGREINLGEE